MKIGDIVAWRSTSNGVEKEKRGKIVNIVPPHKGPLKYIVEAKEETGAAFSSSAGPGMSRDHESYIVHVPTKTGKGKGTLYWPFVKKLQITSEYNPYDCR